MKYLNEHELIQEFIRKFDPNEFSSDSNSCPRSTPSPEQLDFINKYKAMLKRKRHMEKTFKGVLAEGGMKDCDVMITQEQIDELLAEA